MSLIAPLSLLFALLALPIILLYMLRLRRREVNVSSTMLWLRLLRDREANAPWQRLRRNLLLLMQLLILALLVFALARPFLPVATVTRGSVVVLLDGSASMLAREGDSARFTDAQREVAQLINNLDGDAQMTLILVGSTPRVLVAGSRDRPALLEALAQAAPSPETGDWPAALALAAGAAQGFEDGRIVLVSDGGLSAELPALPVETIYLPVGAAQENLAISALATRNGPGGPQLFASVTNYGSLQQQTLFNLSLDGDLFDARRIEVPGGGRTNLTWDLQEESTVIGARLSETDQDNLSLDDMAWAIHEGGRQDRVLLVSEGNRFLETALSVLPGMDIIKAEPDTPLLGEGQDAFDLYVLDSGSLPTELPAADLLLIHPQGVAADQDGEADDFLSVGETFTNTQVIRVDNSPILRYVDWSNVNVRAANDINASWARPLVMAEGGPLLLAGEQDGRRVTILTFRLQDSDLPLQIAFPILMANIMGWLNPGSSLTSDTDYAPGEPVRIAPDASTETIVVRKPDGTLWIRDVDDPAMVFPETDQLGVYEVMARSPADERLAGRFAVNLMSAAESRIAPVSSVRLGSSALEAPGDDNVGQRELWPWLAIMALGVLLIEWWIYHRGARLPGRDDWQTLTGRRS